MMRAQGAFIIVVVLLATGYLAWAMSKQPPAGDMRIDQFARLPVVHQGRLKPLDTVGRGTLMVISDRSTFRLPSGEKASSTRWLLDVMSSRFADGDPERQARAAQYEVFRIENSQVLDMIGLPAHKGFRYSFAELDAKYMEIARQVEAAMAVKPKQRTLYQMKVAELGQQMQRYIGLAQWLDPLIVPPTARGEEWMALHDVGMQGMHQGAHDPLFLILQQTLIDYDKGDAAAFNVSLQQYRGILAAHMPGALQRVEREVVFSQARPFYHCMVIYVVALLLACCSWLMFPRALNRAAVALLVLTFVVHTAALIVRMTVEGRPPVTNLYASAIFVGWGAVLLAVCLELVSRKGVGTVVGAFAGFTSLLVAHNLSNGDDMEALVAVLDTNFWLATHVVIITIGYSATFVAGLLGIVFIARGVFTQSLTPTARKDVGKLIYGTICFATLFSFTGTVLGGIWADQSWGRYWGWDPKENGALIIVLWNAMILHARWGHIAGDRGMAVLVVIGNIVTAWSWFGVNMLGVGLHSYGFMQSAVYWLAFFVFTQLFIAFLGTLPLDVWKRDDDPPPGKIASA